MVGVAGTVLAALVMVRLLVPVGWNPTVFITVGEESPAILEYARDLLGEVVVARALGHDGRFFFVQANDPFYLHPEDQAQLLDRPRYRAQRMLYPTLAGGFGLLSPAATVWGMAAINLAAFLVGSLLTARLARNLGLNPWLGLAFALNLGLIMELLVSGGGALAWALAVGGAEALERGRIPPTVGFLTGAVLTREAMLLAVAGLAFVWWRQHRSLSWPILLVPGGVAAAWFVYLWWRLPPSGIPQIEEIGVPFKGMAIAFRFWRDHPGLDTLVALVLVAVSVLFTVRTLGSLDNLAWSALGFVAVMPLLAEQVWLRYFDITRGVAPILTAYPLLLATSSVRRKR